MPISLADRFIKALIFATIVSFILAVAYPAFAQQSDNREATKPAQTHKIKVDERIETVKAKIASKEAVLKTRLQKFRDQRKAEIAERINTNLNKINKNRTEEMSKHLTRMSTILDKLEARVKGRGEAIATARTAIASASTAVAAQTEKDYTLTGSSESAIRTEAKAARDRLHADLQAVRKLVIAAKQTVGNAIRIAKLGKPEIPNKEGTTSGEQ